MNEEFKEYTEDTATQDQTQETAEQEGADQEQEQEQEESGQEKNFRQLRQQKDQYKKELERERREREREQKEKEELRRLVEKQLKPDEKQEEDYSEYEYIDKRQFKQSQEDIINRLQKYESDLDEQYIFGKYPDFLDVVNDDNFHKLSREHPEIADSISATKNRRSRLISAYKIIKKLVKDTKTHEEEKKKIEENAKKPKHITEQTNLSKANSFSKKMTDQEKAEHYKKMLKIARGG